MQQLNLPDHGVKTRHAPQGDHVFDPIRRRWVTLTPEEWVRQHVLNYLVHELKCPASLISVEHAITLNGTAKRADIVVHDGAGAPLLLVECKAPSVKLDQRAFEQAARYNLVFKVPYLLVSNGLVHYACQVDTGAGTVHFLSQIPPYAAMLGGGRS